MRGSILKLHRKIIEKTVLDSHSPWKKWISLKPSFLEKILDPRMIYIFYVLMEYFTDLLINNTYVTNTFVLAYKCSTYIKHFDDLMYMYVNGARPLTGSIEKIFFIVSLELVSDCLWFIAAVIFYHFYSYLIFAKIKNVFMCFVNIKKRKIEHDVLKCMGLQIYEIVFMKVCNNSYYFSVNINICW